MLMALFQNKESLSSNKTTRVCGQADKNVQLQARPRGLIGVRRDFNLLLHPIVIRRLTPRLPNTERLYRKLQWKATRRMPESKLVFKSV